MEQACLGCNCEDVYFLRCDSEATTFTLGKAEVTAADGLHEGIRGKNEDMLTTMVPMTATFQHAFSRALASTAVEVEAAQSLSVMVLEHHQSRIPRCH